MRPRLLLAFPLTLFAACTDAGAPEPTRGTSEPAPAASAVEPPAPPSSAPSPTPRLPAGIDAEVLRVTDGDTIRVRLRPADARALGTEDGRVERVRYIGMNTPETRHSPRGPEPFGEAATEANRRLVKDQTVRLVPGVDERDRYGRLLADVYLPDGTFVNAKLVEDGFARVMTVPPNVRHADRLRALEREALEAGRGLWGAR